MFRKMNGKDKEESLHIIRELLNPSMIKSSIICQAIWKLTRPLLAIIAQMSKNKWDDKFVRLCDKIMDITPD